MNDDLHDIDHLFSDSIEGHTEDAPPLVWEAISNTLDKTQALNYKIKYQRLKRAALYFVLVSILGGGYLVYKDQKESLGTLQTVNKQAIYVATSNSLTVEKNKSAGIVAENPTQPAKQGLKGSQAATASRRDGGATSATIISQKRNDGTQMNLEQKTEREKSSRHFTSPPTSSSSTPFFAKKKREQNNLPTSISPQHKRTELLSPSLHNFTTERTDFSAAAIRFGNIAMNNKSSLSSHLPAVATQQKTKANQGRFSLTAFIAPNSSFNRFEDDKRLAGPGRDRRDAHDHEKENLSIAGGLLVSYELTNKLTLQSGVSFLHLSTNIGGKTVYAERDNSGHTHYGLHYSSGSVYFSPKTGRQPAVGDSAQTLGTTSTTTYFTVPMLMSYSFRNARFSFYPSVGLGFNFLTSSKASTNLLDATANENLTSNISGLKGGYMDGWFGLGIEYNLTKKLSVGLRPTARLAITPINKETPVRSYPNFLSVESGVRMKF